jgi:sodium-coupled neutral amino acid transporter 7/8
MSAEVEEEDFLSTGFEPDLPGQQQQHHHEESFDSIFGDQPRANQSDELPLIENLPHSNFNPGGTNDVYTVFLIVNAALGAGLLNLPKAFDAAGGVVAAILVQLVLIVFIVVALYILAYAADRNSASPATTIQDVMGQSIGGVGRLITSVCVVIYCFGTTVTFLIVIGDQFDLVLESLVGPNFCNKFYMNRDFTMSMTAIVFILPFCFSRRIDFLRIPSLLGVFAIIYLVALIVYEYYFGNFTAGPIKHWPTRWTDVFLVVPDICFGYQ